MTRDDRDPRVDPKPGDAISRDFRTAAGGCIIREVIRAHGGFVFYLRDNGYTKRAECVALHAWQRWALKAEVIVRTARGVNTT